MEDELKELLDTGKGKDWDFLRFQIAQNAVSDQRQAALAAQVWNNVLMGKAAEAFPEARSLERNAASESVNRTVSRDTGDTVMDNSYDDTSLTTSRETLETMADKMSKTVDAFKTSVDDLQTQMTDVLAALARIEVEAE